MHECRGLNMILDPEKIQRSTMLRWLKCSIGSQARHTLTSSIISCALTDTTLTVTDLTHLQRRVLRCLLFPLAAKHPADIDNVSYRWCPATDHVIFDVMVSVPLRASTALQSAVFAFCACFSPKSTGHSHFVVFLLDCTCFRRSCCLVPAPFNLRTDHRKRLKDKSDAPAETRGDWPRTSSTSKKRTKLPSSHLPMNGVSQRNLK